MGSDAPFHLARIESLNQALQMGIFPVKVHPSLAYSYGYGVGIFYPDFFIYLPAVLRMAGCSLEVSYKTINEQIQNIAQKKDTLCRRMYN